MFVMGPKLRKFALTSHITLSVSWLGAVIAFLVLSIVAIKSHESEIIRSMFVSMDLIGLYGIVPLSFAALITGLIQGLGTQWGLLRYYWVFVKFILTIFATVALVLHQFTAVKKAAEIASNGSGAIFPNEELSRLGLQLVGDASFAILVLLTAVVLSVYKPWGLTRYGRLKQSKVSLSDQGAMPLNRGLKIFLAVVAVIILVFVLLHLAGRGLQHGM